MAAAALPSQSVLRQHLAQLTDGLLERDIPARLALLAALSGEHILLVGPPGTAKSELARRLRHVFGQVPYFERLLTRFSVPEELFGPLSLAALEHDRYERLVDGYLPTAGVAFLDEVFKANSAILNALLTLLNEREFDQGSRRLRTPLICLVGASNEVPDDASLAAFYDRFLLRVAVEPVSDAAFAQLLSLPSAAQAGGQAASTLSEAHRRAVQTARDQAMLDEDVIERLRTWRRRCIEQGWTVSDRRWRQLAGVLRTQAASEGRTQVDRWDLWLLPFALWSQPEQLLVLQAWFMDEVAQAPAFEAPWLTRAVEAFEHQLGLETSQQQEDDGQAGKLALARSIAGSSSTGITRMVSARLEERMRRRYSPVHVQTRVAQVQEVLETTQAEARAAHTRWAQARQALDGRLWFPPAWRTQMEVRLQATAEGLDALAARLLAARDGFAALPQDPAMTGDAPAPIAVGA